MQKKIYQLLTFFILTTISASGYAQNCKFSKEEYNADEETSVTETKSVALAGLATSVIKIKLGKKNEDFYILLDYNRTESKNQSGSNVEVNFPQIHKISEGSELRLTLDSGTEISLTTNQSYSVSQSEATPLFTDFFIKDVLYLAKEDDIENLAMQSVTNIRLEYAKDDKPVTHTHRNKVNKLKSRNLKSKAICILNL